MNARASIRFDWVDGILFVLGFVAAVLSGLAVHTLTGVGDRFPGEKLVMAVCMFGPLVARRVVFGPPPLREPKTGAIWSLVSIASLFGMFGGVGLLLLALASMPTAFAPEPSEEELVAEIQAESEASTEDLRVRLAGVLGDAADTELGATWLTETEAAWDAQRGDLVQEEVAARRAEWEADQADARQTALSMFLAASVVLALSIAGLWARYPRADAHARPA